MLMNVGFFWRGRDLPAKFVSKPHRFLNSTIFSKLNAILEF